MTQGDEPGNQEQEPSKDEDPASKAWAAHKSDNGQVSFCSLNFQGVLDIHRSMAELFKLYSTRSCSEIQFGWFCCVALPCCSQEENLRFCVCHSKDLLN